MTKNNTGIRFGSSIRKLRNDKRMSQNRLASILGISAPYLNLIEKNKRNVTGKLLINLAKEFKIEVSDIKDELLIDDNTSTQFNNKVDNTEDRIKLDRSFKKNNILAIKLGGSIRKLRRERNLSQQNLAGILGISVSYLNLIENNRRNLTGKLLINIAKEFNIQLSDIEGENDTVLLSDLMEVLSDNIFETNYLKNHDVQDLVSSQPEIARAIIRLYDVYKTGLSNFRSQSDAKKDNIINLKGDINNISAEIISDFIQKNSNYFPSLENLASHIIKKLEKFNNINLYVCLTEYLSSIHNIRVANIPPEIKHETIRYYDPVAKTLVISDRLPQASRTFLIAQQMGLLFADEEINKILDNNDIEDGEVRKLGRLALSNYFAGALIMPYDIFLEQAEFTRYDIEVLENRFQVSFEQVCHRLTTLQRPGSRAIPFHMMRVDIAGNISKRFSASGIAISRYSGACPRLNIYSAFTTPDRIKVQISMMPNGEKYFCIARSFQKRSGGFDSPESFYSIGLGCKINDAKQMIYAEKLILDSSENIIPVGVSCRTCPRTDCRQRAFPPSNRQLIYDENIKGLSAYVSPN
tara:strand:+ start:1528 stop:3267 length:1740 start_codon:yes stop_codon:yes gene_type:complete